MPLQFTDWLCLLSDFESQFARLQPHWSPGDEIQASPSTSSCLIHFSASRGLFSANRVGVDALTKQNRRTLNASAESKCQRYASYHHSSWRGCFMLSSTLHTNANTSGWFIYPKRPPINLSHIKQSTTEEDQFCIWNAIWFAHKGNSKPTDIPYVQHNVKMFTIIESQIRDVL